MNDEIKKILEKEINDNELIKINNIFLKKWYLKVFEKYKINSFMSLNELIFIIEKILEDIDDDELELISTELSERNYYENTNK